MIKISLSDHEKALNRALFKYSIISDLVNGKFDLSKKSAAEFFREAASKIYKDEEGKEHSISPSTIKNWYTIYKAGGLDALKPKVRSDIGVSRSLDQDCIDYINVMIEKYPKLPCTELHRRMKENNLINDRGPSLSTVTRYVNAHKVAVEERVEADMRRYERPHINEVWYGDTLYGPYLKIDGKSKRTYLIAFIDDASRFIVGAKFFFAENYINVISVIQEAVMKFGSPSILCCDNGKPYRNKQIELMCARLETKLWICKPYSPQQKGKIERFNGTVRTQFLSGIDPNSISEIDILNDMLEKYIKRYNTTKHSALTVEPETRFFAEPNHIRRLSESKLHYGFLLETEHKVSVDRVVKINGIEFETPVRFIKKMVVLRYTPDYSEVYIQDGDAYIPINLLDKKANSKAKRDRTYLSRGGSNDGN